MKYLKRYNEDIDWEFDDEEEFDIHPDFEGHENFYKFLINNKSLDKYIKNYYSYRLNINLKDFLNNITGKEKYIALAFNWDNSPENFEYWNKLSIKWVYKIYSDLDLI